LAEKKKQKAGPLVGQLRPEGNSGRTTSASGSRLRLPAALVLVASACILGIQFAGSRDGTDLVRNASSQKCKPSIHWRARDNSGCSYAHSGAGDAPASTTDNNGSNPETGEIYSGSGTVSIDPARRAERGRLRPDRDVVPGITVAELCSIGKAAGEFRCRNTELAAATTGVPDRDSETDESNDGISGYVMTNAGDAVAGVPVVAIPGRLHQESPSDSESVRFWTAADAFGAYSFDGLPDGEYTIRTVQHGPYPSARTTARVGTDYVNIVVSENLSAEAVGRVLSSEGWPLDGVTVLPALPGQPGVLTDRDGRFRLPVNLKPATTSFALRFQRPGYLEYITDVALTDDASRDHIVVDVILSPVSALTAVTGRLNSSEGPPLAGRTIELRQLSSRQMHRTQTDSDGRFEFPVVEARNEYRLIVFGGTDHKDTEKRVFVSTDGEEFDLVADSYDYGSITGSLVNLGGEPLPDFELVFRNVASRKPNAIVRTDSSGSFRIDAAPAGNFVLASQSTPSILVQGLTLGADEELHLPLVLDWGGHEIRGIVVDANDNPVPASKIVLNWSHKSDGIDSRTIRRTASDAQGMFAFSNLGPGPHSLLIDAPGFPSVDLDHNLNRDGYSLTVRLN
jgi:5-hydroxyisourate hydrolase-like protein (transthyretin family)